MPPATVSILRRMPVAIAIQRRVIRPSGLGRAIQEACGAVWEELRAQGIRGGRNVALYLDHLVTLEAGVELAEPFSERSGITRSATPDGLVAVVVHFGPYSTLGVAHDLVHTWARTSGYRLLGPRWETYGHWQPDWNADPTKIETEVAYLVEQA